MSYDPCLVAFVLCLFFHALRLMSPLLCLLPYVLCLTLMSYVSCLIFFCLLPDDS